MATAPTVDVLITGMVRDRAVFSRVLSLFLRLKHLGHIRNVIFSSWSGCIQEQADVLVQMRALGGIVVDNGPGMAVVSVGNYFEQVKTLDGGLSVVEDDVWVFKTRADLIFEENAESHILAILASIVGQSCGKYGFAGKIWAPAFVALQPFFIGDQCYCGLSQDLRRFIRYDAEVEALGTEVAKFPGSATHPAAAAAEIRFWMEPFRTLFPVLAEYRHVWPHAMNGHPIFLALQQHHLASPLYQEYLAIYWTMLHDIFVISEGRFVLAQALLPNGRIVIRATSHAHVVEPFLADALSSMVPFPVSYSNDGSLTAFVEAGGGFDFSMAEAFARAVNWRQTPDRMAAFNAYLASIQQIRAGSPVL